MTPKLTPLPPCTATPAGLSMTSSCGSSYTTAPVTLSTSALGALRGGRLLAGTHRRDPHDVVRLQPRLGFGAFAIDPDLALADHAENMAPGHVLEDSSEEVVETLPRAPLIDGDLEHLERRTGLHGACLWRGNVGWFVTSCFH
jgi:hypothetical protein